MVQKGEEKIESACRGVTTEGGEIGEKIGQRDKDQGHEEEKDHTEMMAEIIVIEEKGKEDVVAAETELKDHGVKENAIEKEDPRKMIVWKEVDGKEMVDHAEENVIEEESEIVEVIEIEQEEKGLIDMNEEIVKEEGIEMKKEKKKALNKKIRRIKNQRRMNKSNMNNTKGMKMKT